MRGWLLAEPFRIISCAILARPTLSGSVSAPVKIGEVLRAEMPHAEGLATHGGSESCVSNREVTGEALTGVCAGLVLSRERRSSGCRRS